MNKIDAAVSRASGVRALAWAAVQRHRVVGAALVGLSLPAARIVSDLLVVPVADTVELGVLSGLYLVALAALCWPWTSYTLALKLSSTATIALGCIGTVNVLVRGAGNVRLVPWYIPVGVLSVCAVFCAATFAVLSGLVLLRMRYWPVYRRGCCQACGYDLFGLQDARCPECGTPFSPDLLNRVGVVGKNASHANADRSGLSSEANGSHRVTIVGDDS